MRPLRGGQVGATLKKALLYNTLSVCMCVCSQSEWELSDLHSGIGSTGVIS